MREKIMKRYSLAAALATLLLAGCRQTATDEAPKVHLRPVVTVAHPQVRTILRTVEQPGIILSYEKTAVYPKISGYVKKWYVDIGDKVKSGDPLLDIFVPELEEEYEQKKSQVKLDEAAVVQAEKWVLVAQSNLTTAISAIKEAGANVKRAQAEVARWKSEYDRVLQMVKGDVLNKQIQDETMRQLTASMAAAEQAAYAVQTREAQRDAAAAAIEKAKADVEAVKAKVEVSKSDMKRVGALFAYTHVAAPYDAIVSIRNVSKGDFVLPAVGDPTRGAEATGQSANHATPLYVLNRSDILTFVIGVPETDAPYVSKGSKAVLRVQALAGQEFEATVSRVSWSLNNESRTLRAEIDLVKPAANLRPGMYAYGSLEIERPKVMAVPLNSIIEIGNQPCVYCVIDGIAVKTPVMLGVGDGNWVEVGKKKVAGPSAGKGQWVDFTGNEQVITSGNLAELVDRQAVNVKQ
jgi:multidrug efflux pump subunit AcrA (membrane-fusion protein)